MPSSPGPHVCPSQRRELRRRQGHDGIFKSSTSGRRRLSDFRKQAQACPIAEDQLDPDRPLGPEHIDRTREHIGHHNLAHQRSQSFGTLAEVDRLGRFYHTNPSRMDRSTVRLQRLNDGGDQVGICNAANAGTNCGASAPRSPTSCSERFARLTCRIRRRGIDDWSTVVSDWRPNPSRPRRRPDRPTTACGCTSECSLAARAATSLRGVAKGQPHRASAPPEASSVSRSPPPTPSAASRRKRRAAEFRLLL
ncbi:hypothetical protein ACVIHF_000532 [Bradyrhizobium sp. USDA 4506]